MFTTTSASATTDVRVLGERTRGGDGALPLGIHSCRRRRGHEKGVADLSEVPGADAARGAEGRGRVAELCRAPARGVPQCPRAPAAGLGRDSRRRAGARRHGDVVARHGGGPEGDPCGAAGGFRSPGSSATSTRTQDAPFTQPLSIRRLYAAAEGRFVRAGSGGDDARRGAAAAGVRGRRTSGPSGFRRTPITNT